MPGSGYTIGTPSNASVVIYPSQTAGGSGLTGQYYTNASATYSSSVNFNAANLKLTRTDTNVDFVWGTTTTPILNNGYYCVRWTGQVQPQYSDTYYFVANTDDGVKLWVNDQLIIDNWEKSFERGPIAIFEITQKLRDRAAASRLLIIQHALLPIRHVNVDGPAIHTEW